MQQVTLWFDGPDRPPDDTARLTKQSASIFDLMRDGNWRTLREIGMLTGHPEASISAQLRHFRKRRFGAHTVNRKNLGRGLYAYQLVIKEPANCLP